MSVSKPTEDLKAEKAKFKPLKIEHFCDMGESITVERECQVFVKTTLKGLSYTYFKVVRVEGRVEQNEVLFSSTVYSNNYEIDDIEMNRDAVVAVSDGQSLRLSKIQSFLEPITITYRHRLKETA